MRTQFGVWGDNSPRITVSQGYSDKVKEFGLDHLALMIDQSDAKWESIYSASQLEGIGRYTRKSDIGLSLVVWPIPIKSVIDAMFKDLDEFIGVSGAVGIECDLEHLWFPKYLDLFHFGSDFKKNIGKNAPKGCVAKMSESFHRAKDAFERAGIYLAFKIKEFEEKHDAWGAVTTHLGHREMTSPAVVSPFVKYLNAQMYATETNWRGEDVPWGSILGPGNVVEYGAQLLHRVPGIVSVTGGEKKLNNSRMGVGLAAWNKKWNGHNVMEAVAKDYIQALRLRPRFIMNWSSKWFILGKRSSTLQARQTAESIKLMISIARSQPSSDKFESAIKQIQAILDKESSRK